MGLFDRRDEKKKGDDFDSPVETIDLNAPPPDPEPATSELATSEPAAADAPADEPEPADYGIEQAIQLMRTLPQDNVELVVQVVKHTLESTRIKIPGIIEGASRKQEDIEARIKVLREEIGDFEKEIATRKTEIESLEADYEETTTVRERLVLAEKLGKEGGGKEGAARGKGAESGKRKRPTEPPPTPKSEGKSPEPATKK